MTSSKANRRSFRKVMTRPILYWWQFGLLAVFMTFLWLEVPFRAIFFVPETKPYRVTAQAAYVMIEPQYAQRIYQKTFAAWLSHPGHVIGLESAGTALDFALGAPEYIEKSRVLSSTWQPAPVPQLPPLASAVGLQRAGDAPARIASHPEGYLVQMSAALRKVRLTVPHEAGASFQEHSGTCRFFVETDAQGALQHLLLLSAPSADSRIIERLLLRARAQGAARGTVEVSWVMRK
ncbi:MAG: hypothetical protein EOM69_10380 [Clostridia bacterium]|nr:hypothetical protein [Clostridia bacterium]